MEHPLSNSELRYRRLFESAQDGILILNAETGLINDVNPYLINMLGYSREEFVEKKLWEVGAFRDIEASRNSFQALQKNEFIRYENLPLKTKAGRLIQVEFVSNVYQEDGRQVIQCNIRVISTRRQAEVALSHSIARSTRKRQPGPWLPCGRRKYGQVSGGSLPTAINSFGSSATASRPAGLPVSFIDARVYGSSLGMGRTLYPAIMPPSM